VSVGARWDRLDCAIGAMAADSEFTAVTRRLGCLRGISIVTGFALAVEIGDWSPFTGNSIGSYVGLVPSEYSSGASRVQGSITKTGNGHARMLLVEAAWHHQKQYRSGKAMRERWDLAPAAARARGDAGNRRLHARWARFNERGKRALRTCGGGWWDTGMVDLTRDKDGKTRARLLDLVPGRSGAAYGDWLRERGEAFRAQVKIATLDPFHGYKNAIDDQLEDAIAVVDAFHVVKLGGHAVDEVRRRVQQESLGHRGRAGDALYGIRTILRCGREHLTERQHARLARAIAADERHDEVHIAWQASQQLRSAFHQDTPAEGRRIAEHVIASFPSCPIPEIARLGRTLKQWREPFLAYFATAGTSNGGTEPINGLIELHRRVARSFRNRDNYRLRMLLIGGGLSDPRIS